MPVTKVKTRWTSGGLQFYSSSVDPIMTISSTGATHKAVTPTIGQFVINRFMNATTDMPVAFFIAPAPCKVVSVSESHGAVDATTKAGLNILKVASGAAPSTGSKVLDTTFNMTSTINTPVKINATSNTNYSQLTTGDRISGWLDTSGVTSTPASMITLVMEWV